MLIEDPSSNIRDARAKAALLIGAAELEAMRIRLNAKNESERRISESTAEIKESNKLLLADIREELERCFSRRTAEGRRKSSELRERALGRMDTTASYLFSGFGRYISEVSCRRKKQTV